MKKVLIFINKEELAPVGGQLGYNYNLEKGLEVINNGTISVDYLSSGTIRKDINSFVRGVKSESLRKFFSCIKSIYAKGKVLYWGKHVSKVNLFNYDAVHFHSTYDLYKVRDSLKKYRGKIILTSHTPTKPSKEIYASLSYFEKTIMKNFYKKLDQIDVYAFNRADYFIFPCEEAEEPYYNNWKEYAKIKKEKKDKFYYNPTGIIGKKSIFVREEVRARWGIPSGAKVICYIGRHNEIKGYGDLKEIGKKVLSSNTEIYFLIAGCEGPIGRLFHERWIEIGWTNEPESVILASDIFILPNRETYFDLVLLEVLSLGQVILTTRTGGNKYFERIGAAGVILYKDNYECYEKINELLDMPNERIEELRKANKALFDDMFNVKIFVKRYLDILETILNE